MQENSKEYVMYESFDDLPEELKEKFKSGAEGWNLKQAKDGYVDFINQLHQRGDDIIGEYNSNKVKTQVKIGECCHVVDIRPDIYKHGRSCGVCRGLQIQQGVNDLATTHPHLAKEWHPIKNGDLTPHNVTKGSVKKIWWCCEKYKHEWEATPNGRTRDNGCPYCSNKMVLKGYNDIATTHPHLAKYFIDEEDTCTHTYGSAEKVKLKCPDCGHIKTMEIGRLTYKGLPCDLCSDGISYPEKLTASILNRLEIDFIKQLSYDNGKHKYDFYLPSYNAILETHGKQHYEQGFEGLGGRSLEEEQENDKYKRGLAINNGILSENYHEIDCRKSMLEWCRPNIEKVLSKYIDISVLTNEDWREIDIQAQKSLKIEICKYWEVSKKNDYDLSTTTVANTFGVTYETVGQYLKWGNANGLCKYNGQEELKICRRRNGVFVYLIKPSGTKWFDEPMTMKELSRQTGIIPSTIRNKLDNGVLKPHRNSKYDPKYIGSYIVSAEVYDSQTQTS